MNAPMTWDKAAAAAAAAMSERDNIQANLLDLDTSFGKRLLAGAKLTGQTKQLWDAASAQLTSLWETFNAYSVVVDRVAELAADIGRGSGAKIAEITSLLSGPSVRLTTAPAPLGERELTAGPSADITIAAAVSAMKHAYANIGAVCGAAEAIWNEIADGLKEAGAGLDQAERQAAGLADTDLTSMFGIARANLGQLRDTLNTNPLALGPAGDSGNPGLQALASLRLRVAEAVKRASELDRLRTEAIRRIAAVTAAVATATSAWQDAMAAQQRVAVKITDASAQPLAGPGDLAGRVATLGRLQAAARWSELAAELTALEKEVAAAQRRYKDAQGAANAKLGRRDEMRGLLDAYKAKAAALGAAEDERLSDLYDQAHDMLWTAPCDITAAASAVASYQQAVLTLGGPGGRS